MQAETKETSPSGKGLGKFVAIAFAICVGISVISFGVSRSFVGTPAGDHAASADNGIKEDSSFHAQYQVQQILRLLQEIRDSLDRDPGNVALTLRYANTLYDAGLFRRASEVYGVFLRTMDSTNADARVDYALTLHHLGQVDEALKQTKRALDFHENHPVALFNIGFIHLNNRDADNARTWFVKCVQAAGDAPLAKKAQELIKRIDTGNINL